MAIRVLVVDDSPTIRKVVCGILERHGYEALAAADGQFALQALTEGDGTSFDLILLDFVMPRMNGFQFCRELRNNTRDDLSTLPVVLMSAKSDKIRDQFVQQTGAIDAISKPFDAQALVAVIEHSVRRSATWRSNSDRFVMPEEADSSPRTSVVRDADAGGITEFVSRLAPLLAQVLQKIPDASRLTPPALANELASRLPSSALGSLARSARTLDFSPDAKLALVGDIAHVPIGAILQLLQIENQSGVLTVTNGISEVTIAMRFGLIDMVLARGAGQEFLLGRYFVENGWLTPEEVEKLVREQATAGIPDTEVAPDSAKTVTNGVNANDSKAGAKGVERSSLPPTVRSTDDEVTPVGEIGEVREISEPDIQIETTSNTEPQIEPLPEARVFGEFLVHSGRISMDQLRDALSRQSSELSYEILRWQSGRFEFRRGRLPPLAERARLGLPVASVVMEGFRRVDEWRIVEAGLGSFDAVVQRDSVAIDTLGLERLARQERVILEAIDGQRTVREIIAMSHMSSFDACKIIYQLLEARLVRRRAA